MTLEKVLDSEDVSPLFNVPACVLIARKNGQFRQVVRSALNGDPTQEESEVVRGKGEAKVDPQAVAGGQALPAATHSSPYLKYIKEGATLAPRCLWFVQPVVSPCGINPECPSLMPFLERN